MLPPWLPSLSSPRTELYETNSFIAHAASLHQGFPHCAIFPTAASRRSLGRVSVPMWPYTLSGRLLIVALVGRYPTNELIRRKTIFHRNSLTFLTCVRKVSSGINSRFQLLSRCERQVSYALLTHPPLSCFIFPRRFCQSNLVRLACVTHAASVYPEPGSNSQINVLRAIILTLNLLFELFLLKVY